jgi:hypothetical protein
VSPQADFAVRLCTALAQAKFDKSPTRLSRAFNAFTEGDPVTVHAVRKWIMGEAIPTQGKLVELASMLGADAHWLRYGGPFPQFKPVEMTAEQAELAGLIRALPRAQCEALARLMRTMGGAA